MEFSSPPTDLMERHLWRRNNQRQPPKNKSVHYCNPLRLCILLGAILLGSFRFLSWREKLLQRANLSRMERPMNEGRLRRFELIGESSLGASQRYLRYAARGFDDQPWINIRTWTQEMLQGNETASNSSSGSLRDEFFRILEDCPYKAYYFETKSASIETWSEKKFEFVLVDAPELKDRIDNTGPQLHYFEEQFAASKRKESAACAFWSLGGDARLIAPTPLPGESHHSYTDLASFMKAASFGQITDLWKLAINEYAARLDNNPHQRFWFSTAGTGVSWLHLRVDERPKYYSFRQFAED